METRAAKKWAALVLVAAVIIGMLAGCAIGGRPVSGGSVTVRFNDVQARSITPPISMEVTSYVVSATGPGGASIEPTSVAGTTTFVDLLPGGWTFNVVGRNAASIPIGAGSGNASVVIGQTAQLLITVTEYTGTGSLALNLSWEPDIVADPVWAGELKDAASLITPMAFSTSLELCTATSTTLGLHEGWYAVVSKLFDAPNGLDGSQVLSTGFAVAARIASGYTSTGSVAVHAVQGFGAIEILFDNNFHDELQGLAGTPTFGDAIAYTGQSVTFSATASEAITTLFYLRGQYVGTGSYTVNVSDLILTEHYRLDVIAFSTDGQRAASGTWEVYHNAIALGAYVTIPAGQPAGFSQIDLAVCGLDGVVPEANWLPQAAGGELDVAYLQAYTNPGAVADGDYLVACRVYRSSGYGPTLYYAGEDVMGTANPAEAIAVTLEAGTEPAIHFLMTSP